MQTKGHTTTRRDRKESKAAFATQMTRFEIVGCDCGHEWVRPKGRTMVLPCGKCGNRTLTISGLLATAATAVQAAI